MTDQEYREFRDWFRALDLAELEDVRDYVEMHSIQNVEDVPAAEKLQAAKNTVLDYLDDKDNSEEVFSSYRNKHNKI